MARNQHRSLDSELGGVPLDPHLSLDTTISPTGPMYGSEASPVHDKYPSRVTGAEIATSTGNDGPSAAFGRLGMGNEGKGSSVTSFTSKRANQPLPLRINTGHTVETNGNPTGGIERTESSARSGEQVPTYSQSAGLFRSTNAFVTPTKRSAHEPSSATRDWTPSSARTSGKHWAIDGQNSAPPFGTAAGYDSAKARRTAKIFKENWRTPTTQSGQTSAGESTSSSALPSPACAKVLDEVFASVGRKGSKSASVSAKDTVAGSSVANFLGEPGPVLEDFVSGPESISNGQALDHKRRLSTIPEPETHSPPCTDLAVRSIEADLEDTAVSSALVPLRKSELQDLVTHTQHYPRRETSSSVHRANQMIYPRTTFPERTTGKVYQPHNFPHSNDKYTAQQYTQQNTRLPDPLHDPFASTGPSPFPPGTHPVPRLLQQPQLQNQYFPGWYGRPQQQGFAYQESLMQPSPYGAQQQQLGPPRPHMQPMYQQAGWQQPPNNHFLVQPYTGPFTGQALLAGTGVNPLAFVPSPGGPMFESMYGTTFAYVPSPENIVNVKHRAAPPALRPTQPIVGNPDWNGRFNGSGSHGRPMNTHILTTLPYQPDTDIMCPTPAVAGASVKLQQLTRNGVPTIHQIVNLENLPFSELAQEARPARWGVVKITNIPYTCTRSEVIGFLGRSAKILKRDVGSPVHLIMERNSGKTLDCFVEFYSHGDALAAVNKINRLKDDPLSRTPKLGDRHIDAAISSQEELMTVLFPRASKAVTWHGQEPKLTADKPESSGFRGFLDREDMIMMVKYASDPGRFGFCIKMPSRTYECMISTLYKFPWFATKFYTLAQRNVIFETLLQQMNHLVRHLKNDDLTEHLTFDLLEDLLYAGLNVPAFSEYQRFRLIYAAGQVGEKVVFSPLMTTWPFEVLGRKKYWEEDVVKYYISLIHNTNYQRRLGAYDPYQLNHQMTLEEAGSIEMSKLKSLLQAALQEAESKLSRDKRGAIQAPS